VGLCGFMADSIHIYSKGYKDLIDEILLEDNRFGNKSSRFVTYCVNEIAKRDYLELYERFLKSGKR